MNREQIEEELKKLPSNPGVYIMHDSKGGVLYVGKAVNLYNRVRSYFRASTKKTAKIQRMVSLIDHFEYVAHHQATSWDLPICTDSSLFQPFCNKPSYWGFQAIHVCLLVENGR